MGSVNSFVDEIVARSVGVSYPAINASDIGSLPFPVIPLDEQRAIAAFLDRETERIDSLIAKKERQIELLQEKRAALISHAVTKGLNPDAKMKYSGIEWLGEIPEHWAVKRLKFASRINPSVQKTNGAHRRSTVSFVPMEAVGVGELELTRTVKLEEVGSRYTYFANGDVIVAKITPCFENGKGALAEGLANGLGFGTTELHVIRPQGTLDAHFMYYVSSSYLFRHVGAGFMQGTAGQKRVPNDFVANFPLPLPPVTEQRGIVDFLKREASTMDELTSKIQESISKLREYRTALISAAVTGKIDVRREVA